MSPRKTFFIAGLALFAVALVIYFRTASSTRETEATRAAFVAQRTRLAVEIQAAEQRIAVADRARASAEREFATLSHPKSVAPSTPQPIASPPKSQRALIATDPKLEALSLQWARGVVALEYGPFFRALKLSPEQVKAFEDNHVKQEERSLDLYGAASSQDSAGKQVVAALQQRANEEYEAAQIALLGANGYERLQEYLRTLPVRNVLVLGLASGAATSSHTSWRMYWTLRKSRRARSRLKQDDSIHGTCWQPVPRCWPRRPRPREVSFASRRIPARSACCGEIPAGRINEIVVFARLSFPVQREICEGMIATEVARLAVLGHLIEIGPVVVEFLVREGYHRMLGARPMRGAVERHLQDPVVSDLLNGGRGCGHVIVNDSSQALVITNTAPAAPFGRR